MTLLRWGIVLGVLAVAGCDASVCTNRDANGACEFDGFDPFDGGFTGAPDSAVSDGSSAIPDGSVPGNTDAGGMDGSVADATVPDAGPVTPGALTVEQFCEAQHALARGWRDKLLECCGNYVPDERAAILAGFQYEDSATGDSVDLCVTRTQAAMASKLMFVSTAASACAAKFSAQFEAAPDACPPGGFDFEERVANIGHQALPLNHFAECRAALVGKVDFNGACANPYECKVGYRCLGVSGAKTCRDPLDNGNPCAETSECRDGFVCVGPLNSGSGRVCRPATTPLDETVACYLSTECRKGLLCDNGKCVTAKPDFICQ